ncbi:MAG: hypothetical protein HKN41_00010 [Ilumatobacter sp.]|nr:hypothetical protein [Ilumatobacter sp.]
MTEREPAAAVDVIEIELTGDGPLAPGAPDDGDHALPPNWRRLVAIALIAGTPLGIGGGLLLRALESDDVDSTAPTTLPGDDPASVITTPPTLAPLDTLPPAVLAGDPLDEGPQPTTSQDRVLFEDAVVPPAYPELADVSLSEVFEYRIEPAVAALADDVARRSHTRIELGIEGYVLDVTIERDPVLDRYQVIFEQGGLTQVAIVDTATNSTYVNPGTDNLEIVLNAELLAGSTAADINEYFDRLLLGPVRPDTFGAAGTTGRSLHELDDVGTVRQFTTRVDGDSVPEWQIYLFSPVVEFRPEDRPSELDYLVYVDDEGDVVQVDGVATIGDVPQLIEHRIERLDDEHRVELPDPVTPPETTPTVTSAPPAPTATSVPLDAED